MRIERGSEEQSDAPSSLSPNSSPKIAARLSNVSKTYANGTKALESLSLEIIEGEFLSLLGPSGCGKSTILRLLSGLGEASTGTIEIFGHVHLSKALMPTELSFVFQEPTLVPWATVFDNIAMPLRLWRWSVSDITVEVARVLRLVGLEDFAKAYPRELSGGMKMRASIARALVTRPRLLLMDEPFAALDEFTRMKLDDDLIDIWRQTDCTIVFVTHSTNESAFLSTRIAVMAARPGRLIGSVVVPIDCPRDRSFRLSSGFIEVAKKVTELLDQASLAT